MANTSTRKKKVVTTETPVEVVTAAASIDSETYVAPKKETVKKMRKVPLTTVIGVTNNVTNTLIYASKHLVGYTVEWENYGETQFMELSELNAMRSTDPRFFRDNWVILEDSDGYTADEIYATLGVSNYYKHYVTPTTIDDLFDKSVSEIKTEVSKFSKGMQKTVYNRAKELMAAGRFDSIQKMDAIKKVVGVNE